MDTLRSNLNYDEIGGNALEEKCWAVKAQLQAWYQDCVTVFTPLLSSEDAAYLQEGINGAPQEGLPERVQKYSQAMRAKPSAAGV